MIAPLRVDDDRSWPRADSMGDVTGSDGDAPEQHTAAPEQDTTEQSTPGFGERAGMRRRARFLRKARELAYRDLGGLVFDLYRFGQHNEQVLAAKLSTLAQMDAELRALEQALERHQPVTVLREVGIAACPRCAAIHGRDDRFCPGCGLAFDVNAERPLATAPVDAHKPTTTVSGSSERSAPTPAGQTAPTFPSAAATPSSPAAATPPGPLAPTSPSPAAPHTKPTAPPVAAPPVAAPPVAAPPASPRGDEDEPTQILRPPARGA
jgi:hypothetical protein